MNFIYAFNCCENALKLCHTKTGLCVTALYIFRRAYFFANLGQIFFLALYLNGLKAINFHEKTIHIFTQLTTHNTTFPFQSN